MIFRASSKRSTLWSKGMPNASNSGWCHPAPRPRMKRPPLTSSTVTAIFASRAGCRKGTHITSVPSSTRVVASASAERTVHTSQIPAVGWSGKRNRRWSNTHTESNPAASARSAVSRSSEYRSIWPSSSACGRITPTFIRLSGPLDSSSATCISSTSVSRALVAITYGRARRRLGKAGVGLDVCPS